MQQTLLQLRAELATTTIEVKDPLICDNYSKKTIIHFVFNGFTTVKDYQTHLRSFYDQSKSTLDEEIRGTKNLTEAFELLDQMQLMLIEGQKLDCPICLNDYPVVMEANVAGDFRQEADIRYRFGKK